MIIDETPNKLYARQFRKLLKESLHKRDSQSINSLIHPPLKNSYVLKMLEPQDPENNCTFTPMQILAVAPPLPLSSNSKVRADYFIRAPKHKSQQGSRKSSSNTEKNHSLLLAQKKLRKQQLQSMKNRQRYDYSSEGISCCNLKGVRERSQTYTAPDLEIPPLNQSKILEYSAHNLTADIPLPQTLTPIHKLAKKTDSNYLLLKKRVTMAATSTGQPNSRSMKLTSRCSSSQSRNNMAQDLSSKLLVARKQFAAKEGSANKENGLLSHTGDYLKHALEMKLQARTKQLRRIIKIQKHEVNSVLGVLDQNRGSEKEQFCPWGYDPDDEFGN